MKNEGNMYQQILEQKYVSFSVLCVRLEIMNYAILKSRRERKERRGRGRGGEGRGVGLFPSILSIGSLAIKERDDQRKESIQKKLLHPQSTSSATTGEDEKKGETGHTTNSHPVTRQPQDVRTHIYTHRAHAKRPYPALVTIFRIPEN
ncbi:hypothetical protein MPH_10666 [Macrophomina phaseolina MS6]|uniref:Uncharacterized protein n=1 Tax=Macrophomina phaseolina (strain MS6) TaxID=1126212 RepID=K2RC97_MACPH|nr:hypothetical protein MPH_10666 [Macrophomina phaseolina MS6]